MTQKRSSILLRVMSPTTNRKFSILPVSPSPSEISDLSFKHWHKRMQHDHEVQSGGFSFGLWHWCYKGCRPCRWFDSIDYDKNICKCCLRFRTFKTLGTVLLLAVFVYTFMFSILSDEVLPGGTVFFIFVLVVLAYLMGFLLMYIGLPPMMGHLLVGIIFGNVPDNMLPAYNIDLLNEVTKIFEKFLLVVAIIRAGLLLDLSRIKNRIIFILRISFFPIAAEFIIIWIVGHFLQKLPWNWSALEGSITCCLSLASITSVMERNKHLGYGEDKHLSTVLIAASALSVVMVMFFFIACLSCAFPAVNGVYRGWEILLNIIEQISLGLFVGAVAGLLIAFFPDKRNSEAAALRILLLGVAVFAVASLSNFYDKIGAGVLACVTICIITSNMWEELGWHQDTNPVQYFYTMMYYFGQPATLSLVGFTMNFQKSSSKEFGLSIAVIFIGLVGRESICFVSTLGSLYPTAIKEKIFICIAWFSKGTFQALLAFAIENTTLGLEKVFDSNTFQEYLLYSRRLKETTILGILITTPLACYSLTLLTPILLTKKENTVPPPLMLNLNEKNQDETEEPTVSNMPSVPKSGENKGKKENPKNPG